ncbi:iron-sulfur protein [Clostridia bacterium]|nr:iron-sulfur protein [Clostridia bacterium]
MSYSIYYFSGTGNSLHAAETLKEKLPDAGIYNIAVEFAERRFDIAAEALIFVFPAYAYEMPHMVRRFIKRAQIRCTYAAALVTFGSHPGGALAECKRLLKRKRIALSYAAKIPAVENFIAIFGSPTETERTKRLAMQEAASEKAAADILNRKTNRVRSFRPFSKAVSCFFRAAKPLLVKMYEVTDECTGCGLCVRVCPAHAIESGEDGKPIFHTGCEVCQSCLNYCPSHAINFFRLKTGAARYRHPEIPAIRMVLRSNPRFADAAEAAEAAPCGLADPSAAEGQEAAAEEVLPINA